MHEGIIADRFPRGLLIAGVEDDEATGQVVQEYRDGFCENAATQLSEQK